MASELLKGDAKGKVHPDSRKAQQMSRAQRKEGNKAVRTKQRDKSKTEQGLFLRWLKNEIDREENAGKKNFSYGEVVDMLSRWAARYDDELEDLRASEKKKTRELEVELLVEEERQKLKTGYPCPDLRVNKVVRELREWNEKDFDAAAKFAASVNFKLLKPDLMDVGDD